MKFGDIYKAKKEHDTRAANDYQIQEKPPTDTETAWDCLNYNRERMKASLGRSTLEKSFNRALDSAEGAEIFSVWEMGDKDQWKVILKNLKDSWQQDSKYINAPRGKGFEVGNTITWTRTGVKWLIVWQDLNIDEYFRGEIQRANHMISWKNRNGIVQNQWAVIQGPVETRAKYEQTRGNVITGRQNDTVEIWMGMNGEKKQNIQDLYRFDRISISGRVWRVQVRDDISSPEVLRFTCVEDFENDGTDYKDEDMMILLPGGKIDYAPNEDEPSEVLPRIVGPALVKHKLVSQYYAIDENEQRIAGSWDIEGAEVVESSDTEVKIKGIKVGMPITITFTDLNGNVNTATAKTVSMLT